MLQNILFVTNKDLYYKAVYIIPDSSCTGTKTMILHGAFVQFKTKILEQFLQKSKAVLHWSLKWIVTYICIGQISVCHSLLQSQKVFIQTRPEYFSCWQSYQVSLWEGSLVGFLGKMFGSRAATRLPPKQTFLGVFHSILHHIHGAGLRTIAWDAKLPPARAWSVHQITNLLSCLWHLLS